MRRTVSDDKRPASFNIKLTGIKSIIALSFLIILFLVALFTGGRLPYIIFYAYSFSLLFSLLWALASSVILYTYIKVDKPRAMVGDTIELNIDMENISPLPIPYITVNADLLSDMLEQRHIFRYISLAPKQSVSLSDVLQCGHYGFYDLNSIALHIQDIFGVFCITKRFSSNMTLRIYPRWYPMERLTLLSYQQMGQISGKQRFMEDFADVGGIRSYRQGDSVKRVHWKLSAKRNELMVKDFVLNSSTQVCIVIDTYEADYGADVSALSEHVMECAASLLYHCLNQEIYTVLVFHETEQMVLWGNSPSMFNAFMDSAIRIRMKGTIPLAKTLSDGVMLMPWGTHVLVLTPALPADALSAMTSLKDKGYEIECVYLGNARDDDQIKSIAYLKEYGIRTLNFSINGEASSALIAVHG